MLLSRSVAEQIVKQLSKVIEQHINIMDINGIIVASTDQTRVGSIHGGAVRILKEKLSELLIENDQEYVGAKNGVNLPIEFNNEIIGVIGLTGKSEEVHKYSQIIKKMTEVLLLDTYAREQKVIEQNAIDRILEEWIFARYDINYPQDFKRRTDAFGIDIINPKRIMVFSVVKPNNLPVNDQLINDIIRTIRSLFQTIQQAYLIKTSSMFICVLKHDKDEVMMNIAKRISEAIYNQYQCNTYFGLDSYEIKNIKTSFENAEIALRASFKSNKIITIYDVLNIEVFIDTIPMKYKIEYLNKFFNGCNKEEMEELIRLLRIFIDCEGSIQEASELLFIHKNTLQYRLNKIQQMTGYDPRKLSVVYLYSIAIKIYDSLKAEIN